MNTLTLAIAALSLATTAFVAPAAHGSPPTDGPRGRPCAYGGTSELQSGTKTGYIVAGPLEWHTEFRIHCTIQVGDAIHNGPTNDSTAHEHATSQQVSSGSHVGFVLPRQVVHASPADEVDYLCTSISYGNPETTRYWIPGDFGPDGIPGTADDEPDVWSTDSSRRCAGITQFSSGPLIDAVEDIKIEHLDPIVCGLLIGLHGPLDVPPAGPQITDAFYVDAEGDVFVNDHGGLSEARWRETLFWDCPGYVNREASPWTAGWDGVPVIDY